MQTSKVIDNFIEDLEIDYNRHPRLIMFSLILSSYFLILLQSYFALPRALTSVFLDTWEILIFLIPVCFVVLRLRIRNLLIIGGAYFVAGLCVAFLRFPGFIKIEYATLFFLGGIWFLGDWFNCKKFGKSILSELLRGNYYLFGGLFLSTIFLGSVIEFLNAPAGLWWYRWPFPSVEIFGVPVFLAAFGWFPWILAMLVFIYPLSLRSPKKITRRKK